MRHDNPNTIVWCQAHHLLCQVTRCPQQGYSNMVTNGQQKWQRWENVVFPATMLNDIHTLGILFEASNLPISTIIKFIYNWAYKLLDYKLSKCVYKWVLLHLSIGKVLFVISAQNILLNIPIVLEVLVSVEMDVSVFTRRKYNCGLLVMEQ